MDDGAGEASLVVTNQEGEGVVLGKLFADGAGGVGAVVVHDEDLGGEMGLAKGMVEARDEDREVLGFAVGGDDDGDVRGHGHWG
jgi:hypothetical protein